MTAPLSREIVDPSSVRIHPGRLNVLLNRVREDVEHGPLPSAQIAVAKDGKDSKEGQQAQSSPLQSTARKMELLARAVDVYRQVVRLGPRGRRIRGR